MYYFAFATWLWGMLICFNFHLSITQGRVAGDMKAAESTYVTASFGLPVVFLFIAALWDKIDMERKSWFCFVATSEHSAFSQFVLFYSWFVLVGIVMFYLLPSSLYHQYHAHRADLGTARRTLLTIVSGRYMLFMIVFCAYFTTLLTVRISSSYTSRYNYSLTIAHTFMLASCGLWVTFCFAFSGRNLTLWARLLRRVKARYCDCCAPEFRIDSSGGGDDGSNDGGADYVQFSDHNNTDMSRSDSAAVAPLAAAANSTAAGFVSLNGQVYSAGPSNGPMNVSSAPAAAAAATNGSAGRTSFSNKTGHVLSGSSVGASLGTAGGKKQYKPVIEPAAAEDEMFDEISGVNIYYAAQKARERSNTQNSAVSNNGNRNSGCNNGDAYSYNSDGTCEAGGGVAVAGAGDPQQAQRSRNSSLAGSTPGSYKPGSFSAKSGAGAVGSLPSGAGLYRPPDATAGDRGAGDGGRAVTALAVSPAQPQFPWLQASAADAATAEADAQFARSVLGGSAGPGSAGHALAKANTKKYFYEGYAGTSKSVAADAATAEASNAGSAAAGRSASASVGGGQDVPVVISGGKKKNAKK